MAKLQLLVLKEQTSTPFFWDAFLNTIYIHCAHQLESHSCNAQEQEH